MKDFIAIKDISKDKFDDILNLAVDIKKNPKEYSTSLQGQTLGMVFQKTSTRTRVSFALVKAFFMYPDCFGDSFPKVPSRNIDSIPRITPRGVFI